jgi:hypothetical protein
MVVLVRGMNGIDQFGGPVDPHLLDPFGRLAFLKPFFAVHGGNGNFMIEEDLRPHQGGQLDKIL